MSNTISAREQRCRRALLKTGCELHKSRAKYKRSGDLCGYQIVDFRINGVVAGPWFELDLEDVEAFVERNK